MKTFQAKHISISINASVEQIYEFASKHENLPQWAQGVSNGIEQVNGEWVSNSPMGSVKIKFTPKNNLGILDHVVTLPDGKKFYNPMRIIKNNEGSEAIFTLFRWEGMSDEEFAKDAKMIETDLKKLKSILEK